MGDFSMELCGGTHVGRTGDIGFFKIVHESAIAAGVRRIEVVTGREALKYVRKTEKDLRKASSLLRAKTGELPERVEKLLKRQKDLEMEINSLKGKLATRDSSELLSQTREIKGIRVVTKVVEAPDAKTLRDFGDRLRDKIQSGIILLGSRARNKAMLLCMVTKDLTGTYNAGKIVKEIAPLVGGTGGGRPDMAQAGGSKPENMDQALNKLQEIL
jgi:alanyl-tRNA synthetase (EC 6.1.1.7)